MNQDIISRISQNVGAHLEQTKEMGKGGLSSSDYEEYDEGKDRGGDGQSGPTVQLPNRPTPYEVWTARYEVADAKKETKVMTEEECRHLVEHLHNSEQVKKKIIMRQQHKNLADELRSLSFKPELNDFSKSLSSGVKPLKMRQEKLLKARDDYLMRQRELRLKEEMKDCTFEPDMLSSSKNETILKKSKRETRGVQVRLGDGNNMKLNFCVIDYLSVIICITSVYTTHSISKPPHLTTPVSFFLSFSFF